MGSPNLLLPIMGHNGATRKISERNKNRFAIKLSLFHKEKENINKTHEEKDMVVATKSGFRIHLCKRKILIPLVPVVLNVTYLVSYASECLCDVSLQSSIYLANKKEKIFRYFISVWQDFKILLLHISGCDGEIKAKQFFVKKNYGLIYIMEWYFKHFEWLNLCMLPALGG